MTMPLSRIVSTTSARPLGAGRSRYPPPLRREVCTVMSSSFRVRGIGQLARRRLDRRDRGASSSSAVSSTSSSSYSSSSASSSSSSASSSSSSAASSYSSAGSSYSSSTSSTPSSSAGSASSYSSA